jgi:hypothetical protein
MAHHVTTTAVVAATPLRIDRMHIFCGEGRRQQRMGAVHARIEDRYRWRVASGWRDTPSEILRPCSLFLRLLIEEERRGLLRATKLGDVIEDIECRGQLVRRCPHEQDNAVIQL